MKLVDNFSSYSTDVQTNKGKNINLPGGDDTNNCRITGFETGSRVAIGNTVISVSARPHSPIAVTNYEQQEQQLTEFGRKQNNTDYRRRQMKAETPEYVNFQSLRD